MQSIYSGSLARLVTFTALIGVARGTGRVNPNRLACLSIDAVVLLNTCAISFLLLRIAYMALRMLSSCMFHRLAPFTPIVFFSC